MYNEPDESAAQKYEAFTATETDLTPISGDKAFS